MRNDLHYLDNICSVGDSQDANATVTSAFGHIDSATGRFRYAEGEGEGTVFPGEWRGTRVGGELGEQRKDLQSKLVISFSLSPRSVTQDGVPEAAEKVYIHPALFGSYTALSCLGIVFATVCLIFNLIFRKKK